MSPSTAAANKSAHVSGKFTTPNAPSAPVANKSESPGKNGVTTNPVSANTIANKIPYAILPCDTNNSARCLSRCITHDNAFANTLSPPVALAAALALAANAPSGITIAVTAIAHAANAHTRSAFPAPPPTLARVVPASSAFPAPRTTSRFDVSDARVRLAHPLARVFIANTARVDPAPAAALVVATIAPAVARLVPIARVLIARRPTASAPVPALVAALVVVIVIIPVVAVVPDVVLVLARARPSSSSSPHRRAVVARARPVAYTHTDMGVSIRQEYTYKDTIQAMRTRHGSNRDATDARDVDARGRRARVRPRPRSLDRSVVRSVVGAMRVATTPRPSFSSASMPTPRARTTRTMTTPRVRARRANEEEEEEEEEKDGKGKTRRAASARGEARRAARERRRGERTARASTRGRARAASADARARVVKRRGGGVRELVNGRVTRAEEGIARGKAGSRDPRKAAEEREKMWARLGARRDGDGDGARYAHLLDAGAGDGRVMTNAASMRGRGSNRAALKLGFGAHRERFAKALKRELEEEMALASERLNTWPREKLLAEGYAMVGLRGKYEGQLQRDALVRLTIPYRDNPESSPLGRELPYHRFTTGDMVQLSEGDEHDASGGITGVVALRSLHFITVAVHEDDLAALVAPGSRWRVDLSANTVAHDRSLEALVAFSEPGGMPGTGATSASAPALNSRSTTAKTSKTAYATLQRALLGVPDENGSLDDLATTPPHWAGKAQKPRLTMALKEVRDPLNPSQRVAVKNALGSSLSVWQGPPGTGKTRTLIAYIGAAVHFAAIQNRRGKSPTVLATAASNVAVDNILEGLVKESFKIGGRPLRVVRFGSPAKVQPWLQQYTLDAQIALHPLGKQAAAMREAIRGQTGPSFARQRKQATQLELTAAKSILKSVDVVCTTCVGAGDELLEDFVFSATVVDEATQCTEPAALIPLTKSLSAVLVGDSKQLPPTVVSRDAVDTGLQISIFERMERLGLKVSLLDLQYRMHPQIAAFPSLQFYGGKVGSVPTPQDRPVVPGLTWPSSDIPIAFVEISGLETREPDGNSLYNKEEAKIAIGIVKKLLKSGGLAGPGDIGVISPYAAQVRRLQEEYGVIGKPKRNYLDLTEEDLMNELEIRSVDGFQGREKEVIVLCTVRNNSSSGIGFVADPRRLNVGITRAKRGLIVLGNRKTLSKNETWRNWFEWIDKHNCTVVDNTKFF